MDISSLESWYLDSCSRREVLPNSAVLSCFSKAKIQKCCQKKCSIVVSLNQLKDDDISPLIDTFLAVDSSDIAAVDILHESPCNLNGEHIMSLLQAINLKLRVVDLQDVSLEEDFLWDLCQHGLSCKILNLKTTHIQKLNMVGNFMQLHTLNLDFCTSITSLHGDCFSCMPNLMHLSMCETRVVDLWTTMAALLKLPSLVELRFQNCLCCKDTGPCPASFGKKGNTACEKLVSAQLNMGSSIEPLHFDAEHAPIQVSHADGLHGNLISPTNASMINEVHGGSDEFSVASEADISSCLQRIGLLELSSNFLPNLNGKVKSQNEIEDVHEFVANRCTWDFKNKTTTLKNYSSHHPSLICFEKHYREYIIASLPRLKVLDNLPIGKMDKKMARIVFSKYYEYLPYNRQHKESVVSILQNREMGASGAYCPNFRKPKKQYPYGKSQCVFPRALSAAKLGSTAWPLLHTLSNFSNMYKEGREQLRPRQFEYHPSDSSLMVFGTLDGEVVVVNHENGKIVGFIPSTGAMNSVLGLCWLKMYPSKLLAGSDNGSLKLFDINYMLPKVADINCSTGVVGFDDFEPLTSVHVNSTDDQFLASGYSKDVALYDISSRRRIQLFTNMHREPINVAKFAHHSPFIFATSSFDHDVKLWDLRQKPEWPCYTASSSRGNVMVCFSPDDQYLLVSAVDNEVKQLLTADGRLHMNFEITSTGSAHNYTRSYYMNGRDYIISGSCDENVVRVCCAQTGRRVKDVYLEDSDSGNSLFVQSLRGDPFRLFHMSVLAASKRPSSKCEIIKVNLLAPSRSAKGYSYGRHVHSSFNMGG
ncbi:hypothetical protein P3X46_018703 [Hevea brasiliensis]|uniref:U2A'/phosphoprotein 32 family A C-terminal domain-containing protein n=1 Tax=Hevea brasiliensis TaxID=3981 RepID=A0ABQ9LTQ5_HEVBR|nr:protein DWD HYPERSENSITIVE TO UV-B 1 isoform X2 [Hevea brasiliensis]KAJ9170607.1 hypothetical protein P3X46_018703 [Hevea brasiliensis]